MAMKSASQTALGGVRPKSNYALFLGDLSIFCSEKDIEDAFASYGDIFNVRIQRSKETSRALSYGFIEFSCETAAVTAMNEMNGYVLKGRPLRIRWAAKRNQPVKSENTALHTAATIFVKFASQTGIIVSEALMREHFSVYGEILDATIRTITIDEAFNRSKGYGFVNFINDETQDGLAVAYRAAEELQNATVNGVNYRCEVGHKHQPNNKTAGPGPMMHTDNASVGGYSSSSISLAMSTNSAVRPVFLPAICSPGKQQQQTYYGHQPQQQHHAMVSSGASVQSTNSQSSPTPSSPHPVVATSFLPVNPGAYPHQYQQQQGQGQSGAMSSNMSVGSGSASGVYPPYNSTSPHSPHPMPAMVSAISYVPSNAPSMYAPQQQQQQAPQQQQQQQYIQQYIQQHQQQQYYGHGSSGQYYTQQAMYSPQHQQHQHNHAAAPQQQQGYYGGAAAHDPQYYAEQQYYGQGGFYAPQGHAVSTTSSRYTNERPHQQGQHQQGQPMHGRRATGPPQPLNQNYMPQQQYVQYQQQHYSQPPQQQQQFAPEAAQPSSGRRSQRNVSNQSNISEITSATLNDLQGEEEDGDDNDQEQDVEGEQDQGEEDNDEDAEEDEQAAANAAAMISGLRMDSQDDASLLGKSPSERAAVIAAATQQLKATLQVQADDARQPINCKLSERRKRNVSAGTNTTEITAQVLFDLQQQEQLLTQEEDDASNPTTPKSQSSNPAKSPAGVKKAASRSPVRSPRVSHNKGQYSPPPSDAPPRTRETSAASIAPFTMSSDALDELQKQAELADAASKERRTRRSNSERSTHSDITAALAFMGLDPSSAEPALRALADEEDAVSSAENSLSRTQVKPVCICGAANRNLDSPYASSCPYGTSACSCVYAAGY